MKKVIFLSVFFCSYLFSTSLEEIYLQDGLVGIKNKIEENLKSYDYWQKALKDKDVRYGYYATKTSIITVNKQLKELKSFEYSDGILSQNFYQNVIVGKDGDKAVEGDLKTPVGAYDITNKFTPPSRYYGPLAFSLSYPNLLDKLAKKNGGGIWIHGFPMDGERDNNYRTRGCVAFDNSALVEFGKIVGGSGIVLITEEKIIEANSDDVALVLSSLFQWKHAWEANDIDAYLAFYADDFTRFDGMKMAKFAENKRRIFAKKEQKDIRFSNLAIMPYPNVKGLNIFRVVFHEDYSAPSYKFKGQKELYVRLENGKFKIIAEE